MKTVADLTAEELDQWAQHAADEIAKGSASFDTVGKFRVAPYEVSRGPVLSIGDERVREITIMMPASIGKTTFLASWKPDSKEQDK